VSLRARQLTRIGTIARAECGRDACLCLRVMLLGVFASLTRNLQPGHCQIHVIRQKVGCRARAERTCVPLIELRVGHFFPVEVEKMLYHFFSDY
jgi:hypothetical protein